MANPNKKPPAPELDTEVANRLRDPFETNYMGVLRTNDPLLLERGNGGSMAFELYRDLKRDGKVYSGLQRRKMAVIGKPWQVQARQKSSTAEADVEVVTDMLKAINFDGLCDQLLDALLVGYVPAEIVWTLRDQQVVPARVIKRAQRRFVYVQADENAPPELHMLTRANMLTGEALPQRKFLVHRFNPEDDNPYGTGLGLQLYWPVFFKRKGVIAWNKLCDRFGSPTPHGKYPRQASPKEKGTLFDALKAMSNDGVIMTPEGMEIGLLESRLTGSITTQQALCEYMDDWIMEVLLGQSPRGKGGGALAAAANEREDVRVELSQADSDLLSETINDSLLAWFCDYNGLTPCGVYRVIKKDEDLKAASETDKNVASMGFKMTLAGVQAKYGEHWELAPSPSKPPPTGTEPNPGETDSGSASFAEGQTASRQPEQLARTLGRAGDEVLAQWMQTIAALVNQAASADDLRDRLVGAFGDLPTQQLTEIMALAFAAAELAGMASVAAQTDEAA
ncbi:MAG: DUF935 domain-containing protein [Rhodoferax sp.]